MPDIDNELLARRVLRWKRFRETTTGRWLWHDHKGHTRCQLPNFAEDPAACMELIRRHCIEDGPSVSVGVSGGVPFACVYGKYDDFGIDANASTLEAAIAAAFTKYFSEAKP